MEKLKGRRKGGENVEEEEVASGSKAAEKSRKSRAES